MTVTTQFHVELARLDPASRAALLMAMLFLQSLFTRNTSRCNHAHCRILCSKSSLLIGLTFVAINSTLTCTFISTRTMTFMPTIFKLVFQQDLEGSSIHRPGGHWERTTWRAIDLEGSYFGGLFGSVTNRHFESSLPRYQTHTCIYACLYIRAYSVTALSLYRYLYMIFPILIYK